MVFQFGKTTGQVWLIAALLLSFLLTPQRAISQGVGEDIQPESLGWLEPRGIGIADLVGLVPEEHLRGAIINFTSTVGMMQYLKGSRDGDTVTIRAKVSQRYAGTETLSNCLGQTAISDHWPITVPASEMRLFANEREITNLVFGIWYFPGGQLQPINNSSKYLRYYEKTDTKPRFSTTGALLVPANMGCVLFIQGRHTNMTAEFKIKVENKIKVEVLGSETFNFRSYIGPGYTGQFGSIASQMGRFGFRHDKAYIHPPAGTEFVFVNFPPSDVSVSTVGDQAANAKFPSGGTYRLSVGLTGLSVDHQVSMAIPLHGQFLDADLGGGSYLAKLNGINMIASPEYFVPPGFKYDPCFQQGGCPLSLLEAMNASTYQTTIYYYSIKRVMSGLNRVPLRQVGPSWSPGMTEGMLEEFEKYFPDGTGTLDNDDVLEAQTMTLPNGTPKLFLPSISTAPPPPPPPPPPVVEPDDPNGCPCGWFDKDGRMLDFIPAN